MRRIIAFVRERAALGAAAPSMIEGGAAFAYAFGKVLVFLLLFEAITGAGLAAFYSPSVHDAWGSVAYLQDQSSWGWLVRGAHFHGGAAIVIVAGLHLVQTAVAGAYKRPRELVWWLGLLLLVLVLAWAVTGYVLRWDQAGYWANRVELGIAANTPLVGDKLRALALGGNDYGNLTLTRFYALHVIVLPAIVAIVTIGHVRLARKLGTTPVRSRAAAPRWPDQGLRDAIAIAITLAILLAYTVSQHGADLAAPADPSQAYDARPLGYFRWLFELRELAGSAEALAALAAPAIVGGYLVALPLLDRGSERSPRRRIVWLGGLAGLLAVIGALTVRSFVRDSDDPELAKRGEAAAKRADRARALARDNGVPATGAQDVWATAPMWKARTIFEQKCSGCHVVDHDRKGPLIVPGHGNRAWIKAFLEHPSGDTFWGRTDLAKDSADLAMKPVDVKGPELDDVVELIYAQSGMPDVDKKKRDRGEQSFKKLCTDCHSIDEGVASTAGPGLGGLGSRDWYTSFVSNPKAAIHMGDDKSQMPRFDKELSLVDRDQLAEYLVWLRTATAADLEALGPL